MSRSSEGQDHNAVCLWKGHDLRTMCVCVYEVNRSTNEKVIRGKQNLRKQKIHQSISQNFLEISG